MAVNDAPGAQIIAGLAQRLGIPVNVAEAAAGVAFQFLSRQLEAGTFDAVLNRIPMARGWLEQALRAEQQTEDTNPLAGLLGRVAEVAGGLGGAGTAAQMLARLGQVGVPADKLTGFVPTLTSLLQEHLPQDVFQVIKQKLESPTT